MERQKQVVHFQAKSGFTTAQSNEHQRRWTEKGWECSNANGRIDRTREHLNFEIVRGGRVQPVDKSRSIPEKFAENLRLRGIKDPNAKYGDEPKIRTVVDFIISGSHDRLTELAFGSQKIDFEQGADNSAIQRCPEVEQWAKDMYDVLCGRYGEENILSFIVHLDERSPHIHADIVPVVDGNTISFRKLFAGNDKYEYRQKTLELHDAFAKANEPWGLERGDSVAVTGAKHQSTEEYRRDLSSQCTQLEREIFGKMGRLSELDSEIRQAETRVKGLRTMVFNLENARQTVEQELDRIETALRSDDLDDATKAQMQREERGLNEKLQGILAKLDDKKDKLRDADDKLADLKQKLSDTQKEYDDYQEQLRSAANDVSMVAVNKVGSEALWAVIRDFSRIPVDQLPPETQAFLQDSFIGEMTQKGMNIVVCGALLSMGMVDKATTFAQNCGGGGGGAGGDWGRREDEEEREWLRRCLAMSRRMIRPIGQKVKR